MLYSCMTNIYASDRSMILLEKITMYYKKQGLSVPKRANVVELALEHELAMLVKKESLIANEEDF